MRLRLGLGGSLGRPVPSCAVRLLIGFGKGKPLGVFRRSLDERQALAAVSRATGRYFRGFTTTTARGAFEGDGERNVVVDLYRTQYDDPCPRFIARAHRLAADLRAVLRQQAVLAVAWNDGRVTSDLVTRGQRPRRRTVQAAVSAARRAVG